MECCHGHCIYVQLYAYNFILNRYEEKYFSKAMYLWHKTVFLSVYLSVCQPVYLFVM